MPTVKLNRKVVEGLIGKKLSEEKLKERISMLGTDLEELTQDEIHVEIFPNRPDMLSEQGFARALSSFIGVEKGIRQYKVEEGKERVMIESSVRSVRPHTACCIIKGLKLDDEKIKEIIQMQEKLHITYGRNRRKVAIGIYPLDKIQMPIRFVGMKPKDIRFRPLGSDKEMNGIEILEDHPAGKEYGHLLLGKKVFPVFIDSKDNILSMPPIINSHLTGRVDKTTKDVFVECSGFDYEVLAKCLNMIISALSEMGAKIVSIEIHDGDDVKISPDMSAYEMDIDLGYINRLLGLNLSEEELIEMLSRMGYGYKKGKALVPCYRADVLHMVDLAEDIAIAYGYENIPEEIPNVATVGEEARSAKLARKISEILAGLGFIECKTYHISSARSQNEMMESKGKLIELSNALSEEYDAMARWQLPSLMEVLKNNRNREYPQDIFTIGKVFSEGKSETGVVEEDSLACLMCSEGVDFTRIKQVLDYLMKLIDKESKIEEIDNPSFIKGRCASIIIDGKNVGVIGEMSPKVISNWELSFPVVGFEIALRS